MNNHSPSPREPVGNGEGGVGGEGRGRTEKALRQARPGHPIRKLWGEWERAGPKKRVGWGGARGQELEGRGSERAGPSEIKAAN